jgi:anti-sigma regulatory factor (Ser/Thr protein kinase)
MKQRQSFSRKPESVRAARRFAVQALSGTAADVVNAVELMVSELATNCVRHTDTAFDLTVERSRRSIRVEVTDRNDGKPVMRKAKPEDLTGRGLQIVNTLAQAWGVEKRTASGKTVWFTLPASGAP